jgi:hypothetical protein
MPARDREGFDEAVRAATLKVLDQPLTQILLALAANHRLGTHMSVGQAALFWLQHNIHAAHRGENFQGNAGRTSANSLIRSAGSYGFATWWSKPARLARILSEACFQAVTATSTGQRSP